MDIFAAYATDENKEEDGVVVFLTGGKDQAKDPWIRVARTNNTRYTEELQSSYQQQEMDKKALGLSKEEVAIRSKNALTELLAKTILLGFGNLSYQGKPISYSPETSLQLMRLKDFRDKVYGYANDVELFRLEQKEAASGN